MADIALGTFPFWTVFAQQTTLQTAGGRIQFFENTDHTVNKLVYKDISGKNPYPIEGVPLDASGTAPIIFAATDDPYYVLITDKNGALVREPIPNWTPTYEGGSPTPPVVNQDFDNMIINPQFRSLFSDIYSGFEIISDSEYHIAPTYSYRKSNSTSKVRISFDKLESSVLLEGRPDTFLRYNCIEAGAGEISSDIMMQQFGRVHTFAGEAISFGLYGKSSTNSTIEIVAKQNFGSGGSPSEEVQTIIGTFVLDGTWTKKEINGALIPTIAGKIIGTNKHADYISICARMPLNGIAQVDLTTIQLNAETTLLPFPYNPLPQCQRDTLPNIMPKTEMLPEQKGDVWTIDYTQDFTKPLRFASRPPVPVGYKMFRHSETDPTDEGYFECDSHTVLTADYPRLYDIIQYTYDFTLTESSATATRAGNVLTVTNTGFGEVEDIEDGDTGFVFAVTQQGDETHPQISTITCNAGSLIETGSHFLYDTVEQKDISGQITYLNRFYVVLIVDGMLKIPVLPDRKPVMVRDILSTDTAEEVANKVNNVLNPITYGLPDDRGYFFRSWSHGTDLDPDISSRDGGDHVGSTQPDELKSHIHSAQGVAQNRPDIKGAGGENVTYGTVQGDTTETGGLETRPINRYEMVVIKY